MRLITPTLLLVAIAKECIGGPSAPEISIGLNTGVGSTSKLGGIEPSLKWKTTGSCHDFDLAGGIDLKFEDVDVIKESAWGSIKRNIKGFGLAARGQLSVAAYDSVDLDLSCTTPSATELHMKASAGGQDELFLVSQVKAVQTLDAAGGTLKIIPSYNLGSSKGDLTVSFDTEGGDSSIQVDVNTDQDAKLSLKQRLADNHVIRPSITKAGQLELSYDTASDMGSITTTYKPNHHVDIQWSDGPWVANFNIPMEGYYKMQDGVKISVKTKVDVNPQDWF